MAALPALDMRVLTLNTGSSSIKAAVYSADPGEALRRVAAADAGDLTSLDAFDRGLKGVLDSLPMDAAPDVIGHRIVAAASAWDGPQAVDDDLLDSLRAQVPLSPEHLPQALAVIAYCRNRYPGILQVACSDSSFHRTMPEVARTLPLPGWLRGRGLERYGYHGLSCEYILSELAAENAEAAAGRIVIAHLGHGASLTAVHHGESRDTTMGLTPAGGLIMSTRSGDLDPGVILYLLERQRMPVEALSRLLNHESGLLGISGISGDMKMLLAKGGAETEADLAVEMFVYYIRKFIGAMAAALGGLDLLVFTGGIGENASEVRDRISGELSWMGMQVRVMKTDEDLMIARHAARLWEKEVSR